MNRREEYQDERWKERAARIRELDEHRCAMCGAKDVSLDSAEGRKMASLDNLTTQVNLTWDQTELEAVQADVKAAQYIQNIQMRAKIMKIRAPFTQGGGLRRGCGIAA